MKLGILVQFCMLNKVGRGSHLTNAPVAANCSNFGHLLLQTAVEARFSHGIPYNLGISTLGYRTVTWQSLINLLQPKMLQQVAPNMGNVSKKHYIQLKRQNFVLELYDIIVLTNCPLSKLHQYAAASCFKYEFCHC